MISRYHVINFLLFIFFVNVKINLIQCQCVCVSVRVSVAVSVSVSVSVCQSQCVSVIINNAQVTDTHEEQLIHSLGSFYKCYNL